VRVNKKRYPHNVHCNLALGRKLTHCVSGKEGNSSLDRSDVGRACQYQRPLELRLHPMQRPACRTHVWA
jgi:hypothetical protein